MHYFKKKGGGGQCPRGGERDGEELALQGVWTGTHRNRKEGGAQVWAGKQVLSMMGTQKKSSPLL